MRRRFFATVGMIAALIGAAVLTNLPANAVGLAAPPALNLYPQAVLTEAEFPKPQVFDEFQSSQLDGGYYFVRPDPSKVKLTGSQLQITTQQGSLLSFYNDGRNLLLRQINTGDFEMRTRVSFTPLEEGQEAGLIFYGDDNTYVKISLVRSTTCAAPGQQSPRPCVETSYELPGEFSGDPPVIRALGSLPTNATTLWLKMRRQGGRIDGLFSLDGQNWTTVATILDTVIPGSRVGLLAFGGNESAPEVTASFDLFRVDRFSGAGFDKFGVTNPSVILDGGTYRMWYTGIDIDEGGTLGKIGYAVSQNGIGWTRVGNGPVLSGEGASSPDPGVTDPTVIKDGGTYKMWFTGYRVVNNRRLADIFYATSSDGITWNRQNRDRNGVLLPVFTVANPGAFDDLSVAVGRVIKDGSTYRLWYTGRSQTGQVGIGYATSPDGVNWTRQSLTPVLSNASAPRTVLFDGTQYRMFYLASGSIQSATSPDGVTWTPDGVVLQPGSEGTPTAGLVSEPWAIQNGDTVQLWFGAGPLTRIFYATTATFNFSKVWVPITADIARLTVEPAE